ncbi:hypothetical protein P43SY_005760 [Pythium insidiosum]|uniref:non-specific serine/threonine protein kinase n=1 Tax=Pythium insidiosum TaxID=114742 RepID=A0AAD5M9S9_PYTIN|nr:hypothetical protein P43SY_005760 [Pythium insidiosum]
MGRRAFMLCVFTLLALVRGDELQLRDKVAARDGHGHPVAWWAVLKLPMRPNLFQRNLCVHNKMPATDVYLVVSELGRGAFGVVEKVQHRKTGKCYAMKTVTFEKGSQRSEFEKEIDILRGLHHPNIVKMIETFEDDHHFYIIMELCSDGTPEVLEGNYTQTCDLWSLGVIMFMLLSNKAPFYGPTEDDLIESIFAAKVVFDGPVWDNVSADAKTLIKKLLNPNASERYTAAQVLSHPWIKSGHHNVPNSVYDELDQQHEKGVNLLEFVAATLSPEDVTNEAIIEKAFSIFDRKHSGDITVEDLLTLLGQHFDQAACKEMIRRADADKDGKMGFDDFSKMLEHVVADAIVELRAESERQTHAAAELAHASREEAMRKIQSFSMDVQHAAALKVAVLTDDGGENADSDPTKLASVDNVDVVVAATTSSAEKDAPPQQEPQDTYAH